jgi:hypothetical protein
MDYAKKYYKYKFKYLELKKYMMFGGHIDTKGDSIEITHDKFILLPHEKKEINFLFIVMTIHQICVHYRHLIMDCVKNKKKSV